MKRILLILLLVSATLFSDKIASNSLLEKYCKTDASAFTSSSLYNHAYNYCMKKAKQKKYTTAQVNAEIDKIKKQRTFIQEKKRQNIKNIIGYWSINWGFQYKMTIYFKGKRLFIQTAYSDGSGAIKEYKYKKIRNETIKILGIDPYGAYYIITANKNLEFWSTKGKFYTAKKIQNKTKISDISDHGRSLQVGIKIPFNRWYEYGSPETLSGTNNTFWIAYLPKINKTFKATKKDKIVILIKTGRIPNL